MTPPSRNTTRSTRALVILLGALTALDAVAIDICLPALPAMQQDLGTSPAGAQQSLSVFLLGLMLGQALCGPLLDRYGRRRPILLGVGLYLVCSISAALSPDLATLLVARTVQGAAASIAAAGPRAIVADLFDRHEAARLYTMLMQVFMAGPVLAPLAGSVLVASGHWRSVFHALALAAGLLLLWAWRALPESLPVSARTPLTWRTLIEGHGQLLRRRAFMLYTIATGISFGALMVYIAQAPFVMQQHFGLSAQAFSLLLTANALCIVAGGTLNNRMLRHGSPSTVLQAGLLARASIAAVLWALTACTEIDVRLFIAGLLLMMLTVALSFGNITALAMAHASDRAGTATSLAGVIQMGLSALIGASAALFGTRPAALPAAYVLCSLGALLCCRAAARSPHHAGLHERTA